MDFPKPFRHLCHADLPMCEWSHLVLWNSLHKPMAAGLLPKLFPQRNTIRDFAPPVPKLRQTSYSAGCALPDFTTSPLYQIQNKPRLFLIARSNERKERECVSRSGRV